MTRTDPPTPAAAAPPGPAGTGGTGARRRQPRPRRPEGARCAVAPTLTLDAELSWLRPHPSARHRPKNPLAGTYGIRRGVPRLLELLDAYTLPTTWFVPEHTALRQPGAVRRIAAAGHEIAAAAPPPPPPGPRSAPTRSTA